jgi:RNA polymerase sigma factor (sigma-70 family)
MHDGGIRAALRHLRTLAAVRPATALSDGDLLGRFAETHNEAAFTALVERHGPMVLGVCRRVLGHAQDAEDACQATFLVLLRKAASVRRRGSAASWLYGVAVRTARKLRASRTRHKQCYRHREEATAAEDLSWREVRAVLDEELLRLPEKYRAPLVLCYLEGLTRDQAARRLGLSLNRLRSRLDYGRGLLRGRLTRRGVTLSAALLAGLVGQEAPAALRVVSTEKAAALTAAGRALPAGLVPARVAALTEGMVQTMFLKQLPLAVAALLLLAGLGVGVGAAMQRGGPGAGTVGEHPKKAAQADPPKKEVHPINKSLEGLAKHYALPEGEILKSFRPPHPAERKEFFRGARPPNDPTEWDGNLILLWKKDRLEFGSVSFGIPPRGQSVESLLRFVGGIAVEDIEGDRDLRWKHSIPGDFVVREGAPAAKIIARLEQFLNQEFKLPITITLGEADRTVHVLEGKYKFTPAQGGKDGVIALYTTGIIPAPEIPRPGGEVYPDGSFPEFVRELGRFVDRRVVLGKAEGLPAKVSWMLNFPLPYDQQAAPAEWDAVHAGPTLKHVAEQTGLTVRPETRRVRVLTVERRK